MVISHDIDLKLGPVTKIDKRNTATLKKIENDVISRNCDFIVVFPICGQFWAIGKPDSGCIKLIFASIVTFYLKKLKTELKNI